MDFVNLLKTMDAEEIDAGTVLSILNAAGVVDAKPRTSEVVVTAVPEAPADGKIRLVLEIDSENRPRMKAHLAAQKVADELAALAADFQVRGRVKSLDGRELASI